MLTVATELPNPPFVLGDDLDDLEGGFEFDMVNEIAKRLGVERVEWVGFPFTKLVAGAPAPATSPSTGCRSCPTASGSTSPLLHRQPGVLVRKGTTVSAGGRPKLRFGVQEATSGQALERILKPMEPAPLPLDHGRVHGPAGRPGRRRHVRRPDRGRRGRQVPWLAVVGQFKTDEQYGRCWPRARPNTAALSAVIDQLQDEGVLDQLFQKYFPEQVDIPPLG